MNNFCTYFDAHYLDRGLALHESMEKHCQPYRLWVLALCGESEAKLRELALPNVTVVSLSEFETDELKAARSDRDRHEWIWTCTPFLILRIFDEAEIPHLSYLDADCMFFSSPAPLFGEVFDADVAITPHRFSPSRRWMAEVNGLYNVGLMFVRRNWPGVTCIQDWGRRCLQKCAQAEGADQKYWDSLVPEYHVHAIQHKGVDLAPWNQAEQYGYSLRDGQIYVDEDPLILYHFHKRLEPGFEIHPFVWRHIYSPYREALTRAQGRIASL